MKRSQKQPKRQLAEAKNRPKKTSSGARYKQNLSVRLIILIVSIGVLFVGVGLNAWYVHVKNNEIAERTAAVDELKREADARIADSKAEKEAEKKRQEDARRAADEAARSDGSGADRINSRACNETGKFSNPTSIDVIVNKKHCLQPLGYSPKDLVTSHGATLSAKAIDAFNRMFAAAAAAGQPFHVTSSYRSYMDQVVTYNHWVSVSGKLEADTYSARPGYSEHQTGLAIDVAAGNCTLDCFGSTSQYTWFQAHAASFGFIQRYYKGSEAMTGYDAEEWHYRYVGIETALDMKKKGIKTLEEYRGVPGGNYY